MNIFTPGTAEELSAQWGKEPQIFRNALRASVFTQSEFMAAVVGTSREYVSNEGALSSRVFVAGEPAKLEQLRHFLTLRPTETFSEYVESLRKEYPKEEIGIILDNCDRHAPAIRERLTPFLHSLFSGVGYPARPNHVCIYAGTYAITPMGIHRDFCHVLMFSAAGHRRIAVWPRSYFEPRKELFIGGKLYARPEDHLAGAVIFDIDPCDVLYVPPHQWHAGISTTGEFHTGLSLAIFDRASSFEKFLFLDFLRPPRYKSDAEKYDTMDIRGFRVRSGGRLSSEDIRSPDLEGFFQQWIRVRDVLAKQGEAERRALEIILASVTSAGFGKLVLPSPPFNPTLKTRILKCPVPEALVAAPTGEGLLVGANGTVHFYETKTRAIEKLISELRSGRPLQFDDLCAATDEGSSEFLGLVIEDLILAGAVVAC